MDCISFLSLTAWSVSSESSDESLAEEMKLHLSY